MFERFTGVARSIVVDAQVQARRFGHSWIGCEHLLLATVASDSPAGAALRECGLTPERLREGILAPAQSSLFADLDRDALASIGIDLDEVERRLAARFGAQALTARRACSPRGDHARAWRRRVERALYATVLRRRRRRRAALIRPQGQQRGGHIPFTPRVKRALERSLREALARHDKYIGAEHLAIALVGTPDGAVPRLLNDLGLSADVLRVAVTERYRAAS
jgi:ATP-dependent Clp protease ATP-binding subunit ClpA